MSGAGVADRRRSGGGAISAVATRTIPEQAGMPEAAGPATPDDATRSDRFLGWLLQDWAVNAGRFDSRLVLIWFRLAQWAWRRWGLAGRLITAPYRLITSLIVGVELPPECEIGPRLRLFHPHAIVLNPGVRMGADCQLRQGTTIGNVVRRDGSEKGVARVGDDVDLGAGCVVVGPIVVGDHARVGALCVVTKDVPEWSVVVGNPARVLRVDQPRADGSSAA